MAENSSMVLSVVLLSLVCIYLASKIGGEIFGRLGLPPVLGDLVGGIVVGVSALHLVVFPNGAQDHSVLMDFLQNTSGLPAASRQQVFASASGVLEVLAELGAILLLFEIGLESELRSLLKVGLQALVVACVGVALPFALGTVGLMLWFQVPVIPAIFAGAALTATSIGITSKVLADLGKLNSDEGQIILGAAIIDDILGIIVLVVVTSLAKTGKVDVGSVLQLIASATAFLVGAIALGRFFNSGFVAIAQFLKTRGNVVIPALIFAFTMAYLGVALHLEAILGSFAAGLILEQSEERYQLDQQIQPIVDVFLPIFFVTVGARTDLSVLNPSIPSNQTGLAIAAFLIVVAVLGKVATGWAVFGKPHINRLAIGVGMIPRGEVGLIFASIGSSNGVFSEALNAAVIIMVIFTTFLAPPLLKLVFLPNKAKPIKDK